MTVVEPLDHPADEIVVAGLSPTTIGPLIEGTMMLEGMTMIDGTTMTEGMTIDTTLTMTLAAPSIQTIVIIATIVMRTTTMPHLATTTAQVGTDLPSALHIAGMTGLQTGVGIGKMTMSIATRTILVVAGTRKIDTDWIQN